MTNQLSGTVGGRVGGFVWEHHLSSCLRYCRRRGDQALVTVVAGQLEYKNFN